MDKWARTNELHYILFLDIEVYSEFMQNMFAVLSSHTFYVSMEKFLKTNFVMY